MSRDQLKNERKIFVAEDDNLEKVVKMLRGVEESLVILSIPKDSVLRTSLVNFEKLRGEAEVLAKEVIIESVDEHIIQLASVAGFKVLNPFFRKRERLMADILARPVIIKKPETEEKKKLLTDEKPEFKKAPEPIKKEKKEEKKESYLIKKKEEIDEYKFKKHFPLKKFLKLTSLILLIALIGFIIFYYLPRVDITIVFKKDSVAFNETIELRKDVFETQLLDGKIIIPSEFLTSRQNLEMRFPASGYQKVESKAKGKLTVYNAFSSEPQILVATTRFLSPDGKIFRLDKAVVIPGAKIVDGKVVPSSIIIEVTADKAGIEYNIGKPSGRWFIPGFSGTPKYDKFYAEAASVFEGGFVGEKAIPTDDDINKAKAVLEQTLKDTLFSQLLAVSNELKFIEEMSMFKLVKFEINSNVDADNNFSAFGEGEMYRIGFKEENLKDALIKKISQPLQAKLTYPLVVNKFDFKYSGSQVDFDKGIASLTVSGQAIFVPAFDKEAFKKEIVKLKGEALREKTYKINGLERARIVFWPFWVNSVPSRENRINLVLE